jgi:hypothetical protein
MCCICKFGFFGSSVRLITFSVSVSVISVRSLVRLIKGYSLRFGKKVVYDRSPKYNSEFIFL